MGAMMATGRRRPKLNVVNAFACGDVAAQFRFHNGSENATVSSGNAHLKRTLRHTFHVRVCDRLANGCSAGRSIGRVVRIQCNRWRVVGKVFDQYSQWIVVAQIAKIICVLLVNNIFLEFLSKKIMVSCKRKRHD